MGLEDKGNLIWGSNWLGRERLKIEGKESSKNKEKASEGAAEELCVQIVSQNAFVRLAAYLWKKTGLKERTGIKVPKNRQKFLITKNENGLVKVHRITEKKLNRNDLSQVDDNLEMGSDELINKLVILRHLHHFENAYKQVLNPKKNDGNKDKAEAYKNRKINQIKELEKFIHGENSTDDQNPTDNLSLEDFAFRLKQLRDDLQSLNKAENPTSLAAAKENDISDQKTGEKPEEEVAEQVTEETKQDGKIAAQEPVRNASDEFFAEIKKVLFELEKLPEDFPKEFFRSLFAAQEERLKKQIDPSKATLEDREQNDFFKEISKVAGRAVNLFNQVAEFDKVRSEIQEKMIDLKRNELLAYGIEAHQFLDKYRSLLAQAKGLEKVDEIEKFIVEVKEATEAIKSVREKILEQEQALKEVSESFHAFQQKLEEDKQEVRSALQSAYGDQVDLSAIDEMFDLPLKQLSLVFLGAGGNEEPLAIDKGWDLLERDLTGGSTEELIKFKAKLDEALSKQNAELEAAILTPVRELAKAKTDFDEANQAVLNCVHEKSSQDAGPDETPQYLYAKQFSESQNSIMTEIRNMTSKTRVTDQDIKNLGESLKANVGKLKALKESFAKRELHISSMRSNIKEYNRKLDAVEEGLDALPQFVQNSPALTNLQADLKNKREEVKSYEGFPKGCFETINDEQLWKYIWGVQRTAWSKQSLAIVDSINTLEKLTNAQAGFDQIVREIQEEKSPQFIHKVLEISRERSQIEFNQAKTIEEIEAAIERLNKTTERLTKTLKGSKEKLFDDTLQPLICLEEYEIPEDDEVVKVAREKFFAEIHKKIAEEEEKCRNLLANLASLPTEFKESPWYQKNEKTLQTLLSIFESVKQDLPEDQSSESLKHYRMKVENLMKENQNLLSEGEILRAIKMQQEYLKEVKNQKSAFLSKNSAIAESEIAREIDEIKPALGIYEIEDLEKYYRSKTEQLETLLLIEELKLSQDEQLQTQIAERINERIIQYQGELERVFNKIKDFGELPHSSLADSMDQELEACVEEITKYDGVFPQKSSSKKVNQLGPEELQAYDRTVNHVIKEGLEKLNLGVFLLGEVLEAHQHYSQIVTEIKKGNFRQQHSGQISRARVLEMELAKTDAEIQQQFADNSDLRLIAPRIKQLAENLEEYYQESLKVNSSNLQQLAELEALDIGEGDEDYEAIVGNFLEEMQPKFAEARKNANFLQNLPAEIRHSEWFKNEERGVLRYLDKLESQRPEKITAETLSDHQNQLAEAAEAIKSVREKILEQEQALKEVLESFHAFQQKLEEDKQEVRSALQSAYGDQVDLSAIDEMFDLPLKQLSLVFLGAGGNKEPLAIDKGWDLLERNLTGRSTEELIEFKAKLDEALSKQNAELEAAILTPVRELAKAKTDFNEANQAVLNCVHEKSSQDAGPDETPQYLYAQQFSESQNSIMTEIRNMTSKTRVTDQDIKNLGESLKANVGKLKALKESFAKRELHISSMRKTIEKYNQKLDAVEEVLDSLPDFVQNSPALTKLQADLKNKREEVKSYGGFPQGCFETINDEQLWKYIWGVQRTAWSPESVAIANSINTLEKLTKAQAGFDQIVREIQEEKSPQFIHKVLDFSKERIQIEFNQSKTIEEIEAAIERLNQTTERLTKTLKASKEKLFDDALEQLICLEEYEIPENDEVVKVARENFFAEIHEKIAEEEEKCRNLLTNSANLSSEVEQPLWYQKNEKKLQSLLSAFESTKEDLPEDQSSESLKNYRMKVENLMKESQKLIS